MKSCPVAAWEILCDVLAACLGLAQTREGHALPLGYRKYLGGIPDATVEILRKSYDAGIPRELARCHHMAPVGCGKSLGAFRISLPPLRLLVNHTVSELVSGYREGTCPVCVGSAGHVAPLASKLLVLSKEAIA